MYSGYESVEILHQGVQLKQHDSCQNHRLIYAINATNTTDEGTYTCQARLANGSTTQQPLGNMAIIGKQYMTLIVCN